MSKEFEKKGKEIVKKYNLLNKVFIGRKGDESDCFIVRTEDDLCKYVRMRLAAFLEADALQQFDDSLIKKEKKNVADLRIILESLQKCRQDNFNGENEFKAIDSIISFVEGEVDRRKETAEMYKECNLALENAKKFMYNNSVYLGVAALFTCTMPEMYDIVEEVNEK